MEGDAPPSLPRGGSGSRNFRPRRTILLLCRDFVGRLASAAGAAAPYKPRRIGQEAA